MNLFQYKLEKNCNHQNKSRLFDFCENCGAIYLKDVNKRYINILYIENCLKTL